MSCPFEGVGYIRLAQLLHFCLRWPHRGIHTRIILAVEAENGRANRTQRLRLRGSSVIDHGGAQIRLYGSVIKTLAASPAETDSAEFARCGRQTLPVIPD